MKKLVIIALLAISLGGYAQKIKLVEGDPKVLKGQTSVNTEFTYDNMSVGKYSNEKDYLDEKKKAYNDKEPGKGDSWVLKWEADRKERFEPKFRELFTKESDMGASDANAKYTLIFKTTKTEPGFNVGIMKQPAFIDGELWIVETQNKDKVLAKLSIAKVPGSQFAGFDYETGARIQECYAKAGKEFGDYLAKQSKK
jgi:hypothetical protein